MFLIGTYSTAILFCVVTMLCWGSWANTQKLVDKKWRYELFYWDYVLGLLATAIIFATTLGSHGDFGRAYIDDLGQASLTSVGWAFAGGVVFNIANILLVAAIDIAGMAVAFPVGIGLALVLGVLINFVREPATSGNPLYLFVGVALVAVAIILSALSYKKRDAANADPNAPKKPIGKGIALSILCGVLMSLFYFCVAVSLAKIDTPQNGLVELTLGNFKTYGGSLEVGKLSPYTANLVFAVGILLSNCVIMPILMRCPFVGEPVEKGAYWKGSFGNHFWGWIGGAIWAVGMTLNVLASGVASPAVAYGLGQGATLMSAIWGVFIWREFRGSPKGVGKLLATMFLCFIVGLALVIYAKAESSSATPAPTQPAATDAVPEFDELMSEETVEDALDAVGDKIGDAFDSVKETVDDVAEKARDAAESVENAIEEKVDEATDAVQETIDNATEAAQETAEKVESAVEDTVDAAQEAVGNAAEAAQETIENAVDATQGVVGNAADAVQEAAGNAAETAQETIENATEAVGDAVEDSADLILPDETPAE